MLGKYLYGNTGILSAPYWGEFVIKSIDPFQLPTGLFEITYHVLMYCDDNVACEKTGDSIRVYVVNRETRVVLGGGKVDYSNIGEQKIWQKRSFQFYTITNLYIDVRDLIFSCFREYLILIVFYN